jgi:hypothetical protein
MEFVLDNVLLGKAFVPGQWLHSVDNDGVLADVTIGLGPFTNECFIIVADIVSFSDFDNVNKVVEHWEEVIPDSFQNTSKSEASIFVIKAPVLDVITDLLHFALSHVRVPQVKECGSGISHLLVGNGAEVIMEGIMKIVDWFGLLVNPVTEASVTDETTFTI